MISYRKKKYRLFLALLLLAGGVYGSLYIKKGKDYESSIAKLRNNYNHYIKYYEDSPLEQDELTYFEELEYFGIDKNYRIKAKYKELEIKDTFDIKLTANTTMRFLKYAEATFSLKGQPQKLVLLKSLNPDEDRLFLPFKDKTNGKVTYGAGRYLDIEKTDDDRIIIDFNLAYNPYCAYNKNYKCPLVPRENFLKEEVNAGEKAYALEVKLTQN